MPAQPTRLLRSQPLPAGPAGQLFPPPSSRATRNRQRRSSRNRARSSRIVGASPAPRPRFKGSRTPARTRLPSPLSFSRSPSTEEPATAAAVILELRRPPPHETPSPSRLCSGFHRGETRRTLPSPPMLFFSRFVGFPSLGRELRGPWSPAMAATVLAPVSGRRNGMAATPFSPRVSRFTRFPVWRTLAP